MNPFTGTAFPNTANDGHSHTWGLYPSNFTPTQANNLHDKNIVQGHPGQVYWCNLCGSLIRVKNATQPLPTF
jgi:hypothetical protein